MFKNKYLLVPLVLVAAFLFYIVICNFSPKTIYVNHSIKINASKGLGFIMLNDVREWQKWLSWNESDPDLKISTGGRYTNIGASFTFEGSKMGKGVLRLEEAFKDSIIVSYLKSSNWPSEIATYWQIIPESKSSFTLITNSRLQNKIPLLKRPFYTNLERDFKEMHLADLDSLKSHVENLINTEFGLKSTTFEGKKYFGIKTPIPNYKMQKYYAEKFPLIYTYLDSIKQEVAGPPVGLVFGWDSENSIVDLMAAVPIQGNIKVPLGFEVIEIPTVPCIKLEHFGFYNTLKNAHAKMDNIMNTSSFVLKAPIIEEYVSRPSEEKDTSKWLTNIYYLLENVGSYSEGVKNKKTLEEMIKEQEDARKKKLGLIK
ncbi:MAG: hypothetical protein HOP11_05760 [Saprospiraceae bacterium]|nr:hypothetical protein [Saprospiraceae bacterium]